MKILYPIKWLSQALSEIDGNGGKASFSRILGTVNCIMIWRVAWLGKTVPDAWMTMFWVLIGYQLVSKTLGPNGLKLILGKTSETPKQ